MIQLAKFASSITGQAEYDCVIVWTVTYERIIKQLGTFSPGTSTEAQYDR
jgi:hypothetical protein